ncbi:MAG: hypothetical protein RR653_12290 [Clostridia bacterium]
MIDKASGFEIMTEPFWEVTDVWPPNTLTEGAIQAYKLLNKRGQIEIVTVHFNPATGVTTVKYNSLEPIAEKRRCILQQAKKDALMLDETAWVQQKLEG